MKVTISLAALLLGCAATVEPEPDQGFTTAYSAARAERLSDVELAAIQGGQRLTVVDMDRRLRVVRDSTLRDFQLVSSVSAQVFDTWFAETGSVMIAANLD